jgi:addiction module HigA family antidote
MRSLRDPHRRPTHPGAVLREDILPALKMTQTELAERLGVSRVSVSELLLGKRSLSAEMAARIAKLLRTSPESWLRMQEAVDLWEIAQHPERLTAVQPIEKRVLQGA